MHHMTFWWDTNLGDVFFKGFAINTTGQMVGFCIALATLSILYEGLKAYNVKSRAQAARDRVRAPSCAPSESATLIANDPLNVAVQAPKPLKFFRKVGETTIFLFHNILGYALMLIVMIFNGYVFIAVVGGMTVGYLLFGHITMRVNMENVQLFQTRCSAHCPDADPFAGHINSAASTSSTTSTAMKRIQDDVTTVTGGPVTIKSCKSIVV